MFVQGQIPRERLRFLANALARFSTMKPRILFPDVLLVAVSSGVALAHYSFAAMFDAAKPIRLVG